MYKQHSANHLFHDGKTQSSLGNSTIECTGKEDINDRPQSWEFQYTYDEHVVSDDFDNSIHMLAGSERPMFLHDYDFDEMIDACDQEQAVKSFFDNPVSPRNRPDTHRNCSSRGRHKQRESQLYNKFNQKQTKDVRNPLRHKKSMSLDKLAGDEISQMIFFERKNTAPTVLDERNAIHFFTALNQQRKAKVPSTFSFSFKKKKQRKHRKTVSFDCLEIREYN
mmetsp:Transcript_61061/g.71423  ORF Transcript_61061/g.71423 Transcript_61061/m.71423 type:complete len:222 (-) Transcript_61061:209-874(-)